MRGIRAVTIDFFNTLVRHRFTRGGRGRALVDYLTSLGAEVDDWEHGVLYDVFEPHAREYSPEMSPEARHAYHVQLSRRVFERLGIRSDAHSPAAHAAAIWNLIGPASLDVFPDVDRALGTLRAAGYRMAVVSNWQCGLAHFCTEIGIGGYFDHVLASAEIGHAKPSRAIFDHAADLLGFPPAEILHVGDSPTDDLHGARAAGFQGVLLDRNALHADPDRSVIRTLEDLPGPGLEPRV